MVNLLLETRLVELRFRAIEDNACVYVRPIRRPARTEQREGLPSGLKSCSWIVVCSESSWEKTCTVAYSDVR